MLYIVYRVILHIISVHRFLFIRYELETVVRQTIGFCEVCVLLYEHRVERGKS